MNTSSNHLETVFQEVSNYFVDIPRITVTPGDSIPPDSYTVNYQITGICKEEDGDIYPCETHTITLSLPFGFPHFPPNCLPESPTFHPDFDSSAICIGDAWESEKSIPKLLIHIGKMISGEIFSESNAFNSDAAKWYIANKDQLPFDSSDFTQLTSADFSSFSQEEDFSIDDIDTVGNGDFGEPLSMESSHSSGSTFDIDIDHLTVMAKQHRFQFLSRKLQSIDHDFEDRSKFEEQIQTAMDKAMALYHDAENLEHQGEPKKALVKFNQIEQLVSDYPLLQESKERAQQAIELLGGLGNNTESSTGNAKQKSAKAINSPTRKTKQRTFFEDKKAVSKKWLRIAFTGGSIGLIAMLIFSYFSLGSTLDQATTLYGECQTLLQTESFTASKQKCSQALNLLKKVRIVKQNDKKELTQKLQTILNSPKLQQGLMGKILVDGQYVSKTTKVLLLNFKKAKNNGDSFYKQEHWLEAANSYKNALLISEKTTLIDDALLTETLQKLSLSQFYMSMQAGEKYLALSDWVKATEHFNQALSLAKTNQHVLANNIDSLKNQLAQAKFNTLQDQGHKHFEAKEWDDALNNYQQALELSKAFPSPELQLGNFLRENIAKTKLYISIEKGKKAFSDSKWDEVTAQYEKAIALLEENSKLLQEIDTEENSVKISRIMLHAAVIKDKQAVGKHLQSQEYDSAIKKLEHIKELITESPFSGQTEFQSIATESTAQINDAKQQLQRISQTEYLKENYKKLFLKHYPAASRSSLSAPAVKFLKNIGGQSLFRMQCSETTGGRPLRLQMDYLYSHRTGKWSFYSEE